MLLTICNRCNTKIPYGSKLCDKCSSLYSKEKTIKNANYDRYRDKDKVDFYSSKEWRLLVATMKAHYKYLDLYEYYINGKIVFGEIMHHIEEYDETPNKRLDRANLIYLSIANHNTIHTLYKRSRESKIKTQQMLLGLIDRWEREMKI